MRTRTAARLAAEEAAALETASAREVLLSEDLFDVLWPCLDPPTKAALRGVSRSLRRLVDGLVEVVASPSAGFSAAQLTRALMRWRDVTDLTLLGVRSVNASTKLPLTTATLPRLNSLTVREVPSRVSRPWDMPMFSNDLAATLRVVDLSFCLGLRSIDAVRNCAQLRILWIPGVGVSDLSPLTACSETLEELWMAGCEFVESLAPLKACTKLRKLDLRGCYDELYGEVEDLQQTCTQLADPSSVAVEGLVHELRPNIPSWRQTAAIDGLLAMIDEEGAPYADEDEAPYADDAPAAIATAAAIPPLVLLLGGDASPDVQAAASDVLGYLATRRAENKAAIAAAGAIPPLVQLLQGPTSSAGVMQAAAYTLSDLAANHAENQAAIADSAPLAMRTRTAARLAAEDSAALETASAREVLLSEDLFGVLWPCLDACTKAALRGVSRDLRRLLDGLVEVVTSPSAGFSAAQLTSALMRWRGVTDLTLRGVSNATSTLLPLTTTTLLICTA
ncbi:hypothetical protein FOA52_013232 [Chlamydomonas sp. UWO 241]|nr:hypothetical protein FOA52_013232 [Chlamydomonas sp. UWO 241]